MKWLGCILVIPNPRLLRVRICSTLSFLSQGHMQSCPCDIFYLPTMPTVDNPTEQTLAAIGINDPLAIEELFAQQQARFDGELAAKNPDEVNYNLMKNAWLGRKSGVLTLISENWLKPSPPTLKPTVGQELNKL